MAMITPAKQVGYDLAQGLFSRAEEELDRSREFAERHGADPARFIRERILLQIWETEFAVSEAVGMNAAHRSAILGAFFDGVEALGRQHSWQDILSDSTIRAESYTDAYNNPHPDPKLGSSWAIGKAFALNCGCEMDAFWVMLGVQDFVREVAVTRDFVSALRKRFS